jgi:hypothetical protein
MDGITACVAVIRRQFDSARCGVFPIPGASSCNQRLRNAVYHWSMGSIQHDERSREQYASLRKKDHSHPRALRGVADRLLTILIAMLKTGTTYDPRLRSTVTLS